MPAACLQRYGREIRTERIAPAHWDVCAKRRGSETWTIASVRREGFCCWTAQIALIIQ
jgi:hypothetical protein